MTIYRLTQSASSSTVDVVFSDPQYVWPSGKMTAAMAITATTGASSLPVGHATLMGYDTSKGSPISDGLEVTGNRVSTLKLSLSNMWPSGAAITAKWADANGPKSLSLSLNPQPITLGDGPLDVSIEFDFNGVKSGDPKIKVIPP